MATKIGIEHQYEMAELPSLKARTIRNEAITTVIATIETQPEAAQGQLMLVARKLFAAPEKFWLNPTNRGLSVVDLLRVANREL